MKPQSHRGTSSHLSERPPSPLPQATSAGGDVEEGHPCVLVGTQTGAAPVGRGVEMPQIIENGNGFQPSDPTAGSTPQGNKTTPRRGSCTPCHCGLFTVGRTWEQPTGLSPVNEFKMGSVPTVGYDTAVTQNRVQPRGTGLDPDGARRTSLCNRGAGHTHTGKCCVVSCTGRISNGRTHKEVKLGVTKTGRVAAGVGGREEGAGSFLTR